MRLGLSVVMLLGVCLHPAVAKKPVFVKPDASIGQQKLLARIETLEKRIARLESAIQHRNAVPPPTPQWAPYRAPNTAEDPRAYQQLPNPPLPNPPLPGPPNLYSPVPPRRTMPLLNAIPVPQAVPSKLAPPTQVPKDWQPFEFNGQQYYIVPIKQINRAMGMRR